MLPHCIMISAIKSAAARFPGEPVRLFGSTAHRVSTYVFAFRRWSLYFMLNFRSLFATIKTIASVHTDYTAALKARPSLLFVVNESIQADTFYIFEVFYHAHCIVGSIPFIQLFQSFAGELITFKAKLGLVFLNYFTVSYNALSATRCIDISAAARAFSLFS